MRSLNKKLARFALLGAFAIPGLLVNTSGAVHAASPITVTVAFYENGSPANYYDLKWWNAIIPSIEKANPGIIVKPEPIVSTEGDYYTKIDLMMRSASTAPDLVKEDSFLIGSDATAGYLLPLNMYLATWPEYKQQWFPGMQSITTFNGQNYGAMLGTDVRIIWYNKQIFAKAGLPTNWQPKTWADIFAAANTIKAKVPNVFPMNLYSGIPADEISTINGFEMLLYGTKDPLYDYKTNKWIASSPGFLNSLNFVQKVYDSSHLLGPTPDIALSGTALSIVTNQLLPQGKLGIDIDGSWLPQSWVPTGAAPWPQWQSVLGEAKMPTEFGQAPGYVTLSGGWAEAISSKSAHPDAAFKVLQAATSQANLAKFDVVDAQIAPRADVTKVSDYAKIPLNSFFTNLLAFTQFRPAFSTYPKVSTQIQSAMELVMNGTSPKDAMAGYAAAVTGIAGAAHVETR
jgi:multiple sugar transport system substrate-binding protein